MFSPSLLGYIIRHPSQKIYLRVLISNGTTRWSPRTMDQPTQRPLVYLGKANADAGNTKCETVISLYRVSNKIHNELFSAQNHKKTWKTLFVWATLVSQPSTGHFEKGLDELSRMVFDLFCLFFVHWPQ